MSWLPGLAPGPTSWDRIAALMPEAVASFAELHRVAWTVTDPAVLELCRLRMATLLGDGRAPAFRSVAAVAAGLDEGKAATLPAWPTSTAFSGLERACLGFAEQFALDPGAVTDELVAALLAHLEPPECYAFVHAVWAVEALQRFCLALDVDPDPATGLAPLRPALS